MDVIVNLPDGRKLRVRGTDDPAKAREVAKRWIRANPAPQASKPERAPTVKETLRGAGGNFLNGLIPGTGQFVRGIREGAIDLLNFDGKMDLGASYRRGHSEQKGLEEAWAKRNPKGNVAAQVLGMIDGAVLSRGQNLPMTLPALAAAGAKVGLIQGAAGGAASSEANSLGQVATDAGSGGLTGGLLGGALPLGTALVKKAAAPLVQPIIRRASPVAGRVLESVGERLPGRMGEWARKEGDALQFSLEDNAAMDVLNSRLTPGTKKPVMNNRTGQTIDRNSLVAEVERRKALGVPSSAADVSEGLRREAGAAARSTGPAQDAARRAIYSRQKAASDRVDGHINAALGPTANVDQQARQIMQEGAERAGPLYDKAFAGGSIAPLEHQYTQAFQASGSALAAARRELKEADTLLTMQKTKTAPSNGENVYWASQANQMEREAQQRLQAAELKVQQAEQAHQGNIERMRAAQADGSANAPGAVWSPRVQQFLDDPISREGLSKGLQIQRLEALAAGRPFNPSEYGIVGQNADGSPIVSAVPNMRLLDAVKRGFDGIISEAPKDNFGKTVMTEQLRAINAARKSYVGVLDELNGDYKAARAAWAGPASEREALQAGRDFTGSADDATNFLEGQTPSQIDLFRLGRRSDMAEKARSRRDFSNLGRAENGSLEDRRLNDVIFGENAGANFQSRLDAEHEAHQTYKTVFGNSATAERQQDGMGLDEVVANAADAARGGYMSMIARNLKHLGTGVDGDEVKGSVLQVLTTDDVRLLREAMGDLAKREQRKATTVRRNSIANLRGSAILGKSAGQGAAVPNLPLWTETNEDGSDPYALDYGTLGNEEAPAMTADDPYDIQWGTDEGMPADLVDHLKTLEDAKSVQ